LLTAVLCSASRNVVLAGAVVLGALVIFSIVVAITLGSNEDPAPGAAILDVVPLVDG
jgi:hypothetical protein